jgi:predicted dehydrogenase
MIAGPCRWGILSTAGIAKKNWRAIRRSPNATLLAVASRTANQAAQFIDDCQACEPFEQKPAAIEGYDALLDREDIDAVYIPLPTGLRREWIVRAAKAGKHVLAEKPAALSSRDLHAILEVCHEHGVQYMDGVMFMHSRRLDRLRSVLDDPHGFGKIRRIASHFSFPSDSEFRRKNIRVMSQTEPFGALGDLGWYNIRMILWLLRWARPKLVIGRSLSSLRGEGSNGSVPGEFSGELLFEDGVSAGFYCSFVTAHQQWCHISGDQGMASIRDFVLPFHGCEASFEVSQNHFLIEGCDFHMEDHTQRIAVHEYSSGRETAQEVNMIQTFSELVHSGVRDRQWGRFTLATQQVLDALFQSANQESVPTPIPGTWMQD